jgi:hypothetical protein
MANLKDLIVNGSARILGTIYGNLSGNASTATTATTATKLGTAGVGTTLKPIYLDAGTPKAITASAGNTITPVYLNAGAITALSYTIAKSVPADAKFTDTVYTHPTTAGNKHIPAGGTTNQILKWSAAGTATWAAEYSYTHPTTSGNKHIPSGGSSGQFLKWSSDGTATWAADNNTTYSAGTGLSLSGTTFNHASSITAGTAGTSAATSGSTLAVPYVTYNASGHVTAAGTHTHTIVCPNIASNKVTSLTGYAIATQSSAITTSDSLNVALGKLEYKANHATVSKVTVGMLSG